MDIIIGATPPVKMDSSKEHTTPHAGKKVLRDRRKHKQDRRRSVREGIFVSLSMENDRRALRDRRRVSS